MDVGQPAKCAQITTLPFLAPCSGPKCNLQLKLYQSVRLLPVLTIMPRHPRCVRICLGTFVSYICIHWSFHHVSPSPNSYWSWSKEAHIVQWPCRDPGETLSSPLQPNVAKNWRIAVEQKWWNAPTNQTKTITRPYLASLVHLVFLVKMFSEPIFGGSLLCDEFDPLGKALPLGVVPGQPNCR